MSRTAPRARVSVKAAHLRVCPRRPIGRKTLNNFATTLKHHTIVVILYVVGLIACCGATPAAAFGQTSVLATSGVWVALAHQKSLAASPDVCVAYETNKGVGFRDSPNAGFSIKIVDYLWSLPASVSGSIDIIVGGQSFSYSITEHTGNSVSASVLPAEVLGLLDKIDSSASMMVQTGTDPAVTVPLDGSKIVFMAFRTCAGIGGGASGPDGNPFQ